MTIEFYNGILYKIEYKPELSTNRYTQKHVYHIHTEQENYSEAKKAIHSIMNDGTISKGEYLMINKRNPSFENHLKEYFEFSFDEDKNVYVYTKVTPYDD